MQSLIRLRTDDFEVQQGTKGTILCTGIKGMALTMFWSPGCEICKSVLSIFQQLPQVVNGVKFCLLNINENQQVLAMAKSTIAPIEYVPYIVMYVNGKPFLQFDDEPTGQKLIQFIQYTMGLVETKKSFIDRGAKVESDIPAYSIAKPYLSFKCDDEKCYLAYEDAYPGAKPPNGGTQGRMQDMREQKVR